MLKLLKVSGNSLLPLYRDGDFVLVSKIPYLFGAIRRGDVVVFRHDVYGTMIKKVESIAPDKDEIMVIGTQENSVDSRRFGVISERDVLGKVIWHIRKPIG
jgi:signal peptidase I